MKILDKLTSARGCLYRWMKTPPHRRAPRQMHRFLEAQCQACSRFWIPCLLFILAAPMCLSAQIFAIDRITYGSPLIDSVPASQFPRGGSYTAIVWGIGLSDVTEFVASDPRVGGYVISASDGAVTVQISSTPVNDGDTQDAPIPSVSFSLIDKDGIYIPSPITFDIVIGPAPQVTNFEITNGVKAILQGVPTTVEFSFETLSSGNIHFLYVGCGDCTTQWGNISGSQFDYVLSFTEIVNIPSDAGTVTSFGIEAGAVDGSGQGGNTGNDPLSPVSLTIPVVHIAINDIFMVDPDTLQVNVTAQFSQDPNTSKQITVSTTIEGVDLQSTLQLASGDTGQQQTALLVQLNGQDSNGNVVPRFTDNEMFPVTAMQSENDTQASSTFNGFILLPTIVVPGITLP